MNLKRAVKIFLNFFMSAEVTFTNYTAMPAKVTRLTEAVILKHYPIILFEIFLSNK